MMCPHSQIPCKNSQMLLPREEAAGTGLCDSELRLVSAYDIARLTLRH